MDWGLLLRGLIIGIVLAAPIGPVNVLCMQRTLSRGRLNGFVAGLGAAAADATYGAVAAFGLTAIAEVLTGHPVPVRLVGGILLLAIGARIFRAPPAPLDGGEFGRGLVRAFAVTFAVTIANPTTILTFAGIFAGTGLITPGVDYLGAATIVLGVFLGSGAWWLALSLVVGLLRHRLSPRALGWINRASGALIAAFGVGALASLLALA